MDTNKVLEKMRMLKLQETIKIIENRIVNQADKREWEQALLENKVVNVKYMGKAEFEGKWQDIYKIFEQYQKDLEKLGQFVSTLNNVDRVEFLPYHGMGIHKWENMGFEYELKDVQEPTPEEIKRASDIVESFGVEVHNNKAAK